MVSMRTLECLVSIVEHGSLTRAAAVLNMSQPALSHQIAALERELGTPVIERRPRGVRHRIGLPSATLSSAASTTSGRNTMPAPPPNGVSSTE